MGELISDFVNEHKKVKKMVEKTLSKVGGGCKIYLSSSIYKSKEEERKRRVLEAEKKKAEEAKRKELYDLMKVSTFPQNILLPPQNILLFPQNILLFL